MLWCQSSSLSVYIFGHEIAVQQQVKPSVHSWVSRDRELVVSCRKYKFHDGGASIMIIDYKL